MFSNATVKGKRTHHDQADRPTPESARAVAHLVAAIALAASIYPGNGLTPKLTPQLHSGLQRLAADVVAPVGEGWG